MVYVHTALQIIALNTSLGSSFLGPGSAVLKSTSNLGLPPTSPTFNPFRDPRLPIVLCLPSIAAVDPRLGGALVSAEMAF